jgi:hypothetical protein
MHSSRYHCPQCIHCDIIALNAFIAISLPSNIKEKFDPVFDGLMLGLWDPRMESLDYEVVESMAYRED